MTLDAETAFEAPWQARAFALAVSLQEAGVLPGPEFARRLGLALQGTGEGQEAYYSAWLSALEAFVLEAGLFTTGDLEASLAVLVSAGGDHDDDHDHHHDDDHAHHR